MDITGWEERYRSSESGKDEAATTLLVEIADTLPPGAALDLACGTGRNTLYLAAKGWTVTALDGSTTAIELLRLSALARGLEVRSDTADLTAAGFMLPSEAFDLLVIAFYLQRDLFAKAKLSTRPGGLVLAIAHTPDPGEKWTEKRAAPGELRGLFSDWEILHDYEGPSRDPAHRRSVAELVARRPGGETK